MTTVDTNLKIAAIGGKLCRVEQSGYGDWGVIPPAGYTAGREGCRCTAISILTDGSCICAPGDLSMLPCLRKIEPAT